MQIPDMKSIAQAVMLTAISLIVINLAKPYLPAVVADKLKG